MEIRMDLRAGQVSKTCSLDDVPSKPRERWMPWQLRGICIFCQSYAVFMTTFVPIYCIYLCHMLPQSGMFGVTFATCLFIYVCLNLYTNWWCFKRRQPGSVAVSEDERERHEWTESGSRYCPDCCSYVPHDTHHCIICDVCIKRRDHHCFFLGGCVGLGNLGNFIAFCFHASVGCSYGSLLLTQHLRREYKELFSTSDFMYYIVPFATVKWLVGAVATSHFFSLVLLSLAFTTFLGTLFLVFFHLYLVFLAKTSNEFLRPDESGGRLKSFRNFNRFLGKNWCIGVLFPVFCFTRNKSGSIKWEFIKLL